MTQTAAQMPLGANVAEFTVSELAGAIKRALEEGFGYVRLRGEVSGFRGPHASGHCYFALKDDKAKIEAVIWKPTYQRLKVKPQEGLEVVVQGRITAYPGSSKYQIVIESLEPAGLGALMALLEERKRKLAAEGLFDAARKKAAPLPAARRRHHYLADGRRHSRHAARLRGALSDARAAVAGARAGRDVRAGGGLRHQQASTRLCRAGRSCVPTCMIVARGGGSLEDLMGFNEEIVVRAVAESLIPVISAVGHETDWTLIDLVADARAPTPTKAAEWAVPKFSELAESTEKLGLRLMTAARRSLNSARTHLKAAVRGLPRLEDIVALPRQRFDACDKRLSRALLANTRAHHTRFARVASRLRPATVRQRLSLGIERLAGLDSRARSALANRITARRRQLDALRPAAGLSQLPERAAARLRAGARRARAYAARGCGRACRRPHGARVPRRPRRSRGKKRRPRRGGLARPRAGSGADEAAGPVRPHAASGRRKSRLTLLSSQRNAGLTAPARLAKCDVR